MVKTSRHQAPFWASLLLLLAFIAAQPLLAEHIHIEDSAPTLCDLGFNHMPAAVASKFKFTDNSLVPLYQQPLPTVALNTQSKRPNARSPPVFLSLS